MRPDVIIATKIYVLLPKERFYKVGILQGVYAFPVLFFLLNVEDAEYNIIPLPANFSLSDFNVLAVYLWGFVFFLKTNSVWFP
jgi:hypothetical protein